jgi:hypothetical protein
MGEHPGQLLEEGGMNARWEMTDVLHRTFKVCSTASHLEFSENRRHGEEEVW